MDSLLQIIKNLKKEEIRNFKIFTNRFQRSEDIKITTLFDFLRAGKYNEDDRKLIALLFPDDTENANAYYRLKNRLKTELEKSLLNLHHNLDEKVATINFITLSSIFLYKSQYELAVYYLRKAEKVAVNNEFYDLLDLIYGQLIELADNFNEINPMDYIDKKNENAKKNSIIMQANNAIASILFRLRKTNFSNKEEEIGITLQRIMEELNIAAEIYTIPKVKLRVHTCIRNILLQNHDFVRLEGYLISSLKEFEEENLFNKTTHTTKIVTITWIINSLMINKRWAEAIDYTEMLLEELNKYNKLYYDNFIWTYYQSLITNYMCSNRVDDAITLLEQITELPAHKGVTFYEYAIHCNLALCYYYKRNYTTAIKSLARLFTKDIYPKLSAEFQFSISLIEVIVHYENNNLDYVSYRISEIKRHFRGLLKQPGYQQEKHFLKILTTMSNKPDPMRDKQMLVQMHQFAEEAQNLQVGSGKHIDTGIWMKAKLDRQPYYNYLYRTLQAPEVPVAHEVE
jgi:tetratricopeptide (TPR) repeat protein